MPSYALNVPYKILKLEYLRKSLFGAPLQTKVQKQGRRFSCDKTVTSSNNNSKNICLSVHGGEMENKVFTSRSHYNRRNVLIKLSRMFFFVLLCLWVFHALIWCYYLEAENEVNVMISRKYCVFQTVSVNLHWAKQSSFYSTTGSADPNESNWSRKGAASGSRLSPFTQYSRALRWSPLPIGIAFVAIAYQQYLKVHRRSSDIGTKEALAKNWEITCYRMMPLKVISRTWGWINNVNLPMWSRGPLLSWYAKSFNCNVAEAEVEDLHYYKNLGEFFRRSLKNGVRPIDADSSIVSPADGTVLHFGRVECGRIEQVKGVTYSLPAFLGNATWMKDKYYESLSNSDEDFCSKILSENKETCLYHCVIYLAPGDYHRFHSPVEWNVTFRRHFAGELMSVNPSVAKWIAGLFSLNERAVYIGEWKHGFFSMTAVGATNVGSIRVYDDADLYTNNRRLRKNTHEDKHFEKPLTFKKGDCFGEFNLGSTIVLVFEAPVNMDFSVSPGQKINFGQGVLANANDASSTISSSSSSNVSNSSD